MKARHSSAAGTIALAVTSTSDVQNQSLLATGEPVVVAADPVLPKPKQKFDCYAILAHLFGIIDQQILFQSATPFAVRELVWKELKKIDATNHGSALFKVKLETVDIDHLLIHLKNLVKQFVPVDDLVNLFD